MSSCIQYEQESLWILESDLGSICVCSGQLTGNAETSPEQTTERFCGWPSVLAAVLLDGLMATLIQTARSRLTWCEGTLLSTESSVIKGEPGVFGS